MRTYSTPQSALQLEITKLAIIECCISVALYVVIGINIGSFKFLAMAIITAPVMLLRTEVSSEWGLKLYERYFNWLESDLRAASSFQKVKFFGGHLIVGPVVGVGIRIFATLYWAVRRPLEALGEVPRNWLRQAICTDFFHPPEILPLEAARGDRNKIFVFAEIWESQVSASNAREWLLNAVIATPVFMIGYLPSLFYRISFKATSVAYLPLIWVAHATVENPMPIQQRLKRITKGEFEKVRRVLSWGIIATLLAKLGFILGWVDWGRIEEKFPSKRLVENLVVPVGWPWWQITLAADALLTFFLLFYADAALSRLEAPQSWNEPTVLNTISAVTFLRAAMSLLTVSHFFHIALIAAFPALHLN